MENMNNNEDTARNNTELYHPVDADDSMEIAKDQGTFCLNCENRHDTTGAICPLVKDAFEKGRVCVVCGEGRGEECVFGLVGSHCRSRSCETEDVHCEHMCSDWVRCEPCENKVDQEFCGSRCNAGTCDLPMHHCQHKCPFTTRMFTQLSLVFHVLGLVLYVWDILSDLVLAGEYFNDGDVIWGSLTLAFFVVAGLGLSALNLYQWGNVKNEFREDKFLEDNFPVTLFTIGFFATAVFLVTPPMWVVVLIFVWRKGRKYLTGENDNLRDTDILQKAISSKVANSQMVEAFIEAAPQFLLQLYIVFSSPWEGWTQKLALQVFSIGTALFSLSWTLVCLYCSFHVFDIEHPSNLKEKIVVLIWEFFVVIPRFFALGLFASMYEWYILVILFIHTSIVFTIHFYKAVEKNSAAAANSLFIAVISNFGFNRKLTFHEEAKEEKARFHDRTCYPEFYTLVFIENIVMISLWFSRFSNSHHFAGSDANLAVNRTANHNVSMVTNNTVLSAGSKVAAPSLPYWPAIAALVLVLVSYFVAYSFRYVHRRFIVKERVRFFCWWSRG